MKHPNGQLWNFIVNAIFVVVGSTGCSRIEPIGEAVSAPTPSTTQNSRNPSEGDASGPASLEIVAALSSGTILIYDGDALWRTVDRGATWRRASVGGLHQESNGQSRAMCFVSERVGFFFSGQSIYRTSDGGAEWNLTGTVERQFRVKDCAFHNLSDGWIVGYRLNDDLNLNSYYGGAMRTNNGGKSWTDESNRLLAKSASVSTAKWMYRAITFTGNCCGWIGGDGVILWTSNAGGTWNVAQRLRDSARINHFYPITSRHILATTWQPSDIYSSKDGGVTWSRTNPPVHFGSRQVSVLFLSEKVGYAAVDRLYRTDDGGAIWIPVGDTDDEITQVVEKAFDGSLIAIGQDEFTGRISVRTIVR